MLIIAVDVFRDHEHMFRVTTVNCYPEDRSQALRGCDFALEFRKMALKAIVQAAKEHRLRTEIPNDVVYLSLVGSVQQVLNEHYRQTHLATGNKSITPRRKLLQLAEIRRYVDVWVNGFFLPGPDDAR